MQRHPGARRSSASHRVRVARAVRALACDRARLRRVPTVVRALGAWPPLPSLAGAGLSVDVQPAP
jgi:hypothetical protein